MSINTKLQVRVDFEFSDAGTSVRIMHCIGGADYWRTSSDDRIQPFTLKVADGAHFTNRMLEEVLEQNWDTCPGWEDGSVIEVSYEDYGPAFEVDEWHDWAPAHGVFIFAVEGGESLRLRYDYVTV